MLLTEYEKYESLKALKQFLLAILLMSSLIAFQQSYARSHQGAIEQPVGLLGLAEYYFRHPEVFVGLHFSYPVTPVGPPQLNQYRIKCDYTSLELLDSRRIRSIS